MHVLQVEDDATTARSVELMLETLGHSCDTAASGEAALGLAAERDYDLVLLDIMLPDIDGYEVLKRLQEAGVLTPVLIQSGLVRHERDRPAFGVIESLIKPFGPRELQQRIGAVTEQFDRLREEQAAAAPAPERRQAPRTRTLKRGQIQFYGEDGRMGCVILSLSEGGAAIQPEDPLSVPDYFQLRLEEAAPRDCQVSWRHADKLGIRFLAA